LDPELKGAQKHAQQEYTSNNHQEEYEEPIILRQLLSDEQINEILKSASQDGVWPRGVCGDNDDTNNKQESTNTAERTAATATEELSDVPHHYAWTKEHVVLYMHNNNHWFVRLLPEAWGRIRGGMESRPWMNGAIPELDDAFIGVDTPSMTQVRTVELHHYAAGGGLVTPGHRDCGSDMTLSVLLSDTDDVEGGDFVTYREGVPVAHKMRRGDAILFSSMALHNIGTVTAGLRQSLVVELWPTQRY